MDKTFETGTLVENWAMGFGRVIGVMTTGLIVVRFGYLPHDKQIRYFTPEEAQKHLRIIAD